MKTILQRLFNHECLSRAEAEDTLLRISAGAFNPVQVASFITAYNMRPITVRELEGFRDAMLQNCIPFSTEGRDTLDIVGTGGDGKNTFNVSTTSAIVIAGAGYPVTKHGSYGVSSAVGSSNVLIALGYEFTNDQDTLLRQLESAGICFLHAPLFHPAMKEVVPIRKQLGMRSFFNLLGPLVNPVQPTYQLYGTVNREVARLYQYVMQASGRRFAVVYALDGYDEISLTGAFQMRTNESEQLLYPADLGLPAISPDALHGGETPEAAAKIFRSVLENKATEAQKNVVIANAGTAIHCIHQDRSLTDCLAEARESIESGSALAVLRKLLD